MRVNLGSLNLIKHFVLLRPEADPAVLLAWIENEMDLANVHRAARVRTNIFAFAILFICVSQLKFERHSYVNKLFLNMWGDQNQSRRKLIEASVSLGSTKFYFYSV